MEYLTRRGVSYPHLNAAGRLFGGQALSWIDEEAAIFAACQMGSSSLVTKKMSEVEFKSPGNLGDILMIGTEIVRSGRTSMTVACEIVNKTTSQVIVRVDEIVFVSLDADGNPQPHQVWLDANPDQS